MISFSDLSIIHNPLKERFHEILDECLEKSSFIGETVFSDSMKEYVSSKNCVTCNSGTDALYIAIKALDLAPGSRIAVPAVSYAATAMAVVNAGHIPVFIDVDPVTALIKWDLVKDVDCVIPVHLFGQYSEIPDGLTIPVIEDCAQAIGLRVDGIHVGNKGAIGCFSFYPGKNLGALGDGGACITNDDNLAKKMLMYARLGSEPTNRYNHVTDGINSRLDTIQGLFLNEKLKYIDTWTEQRRQLAKLYETTRDIDRDVFHVFYILVDDREEFKKRFEGVAHVNCHYPIALSELPCFSKYKIECQNAKEFCKRCLSIPFFPGMTDEEVEKIKSIIHKC